MKKNLAVAVGIVYNARHQVLLAWRSANKDVGSCWEFPGGKLEPGESSYQALCRELNEEINIRVISARPLPAIVHKYVDYQVTLYPWVVLSFSGIPFGKEGQEIKWSRLEELPHLQLPAANYAMLNQIKALKI